MNPIIARSHIEKMAEQIAPHCDGDELLLQDMMEAETDFITLANWLHERIATGSEQLAGIKERKDSLAIREKRIKAQVDAAKAEMGKLLRAAKLPNVAMPEATYSVRDGKAKLVVNDVEAVPSNLSVTKLIPDKQAINAKYADSEELPNWLTREAATDIVTARVK